MTVTHLWRSLLVVLALGFVTFSTVRSTPADVAGCWITVEYNCSELTVPDPCAGICEFTGEECGTAFSMDSMKKVKAVTSVQYPHRGTNSILTNPPLPQQFCGSEWKCICVQPSGGGVIGCESSEDGGNVLNIVSEYLYKPSIAVGNACTGLIYEDEGGVGG